MIAKEKKQAIIAEYGREQKRLSFKTWSFKDGWSETWFTGILKES